MTPTSLPASYDMRSIMDGSNFIYSSTSKPLSATLFGVYNQGQIGDCTANAGAGAMQFCQIRDVIAKLPTGAKVSTSNVIPFVPSRLFIYWNERLNSGGVSATKVDNGASMSDIIYALVNNGVCPETDWPETNYFSTKPLTIAFTDALKDVDMDVTAKISSPVTESSIISNVVATQITGAGTTLLTNIKAALYSNHPVLFGISVYSSFESTNADSTGVIPLPPTNDELLGGHALMFVGYNDNATYPSYTFNYTSNTNKPKTATQAPLTGYFTFRNSWGSGTGSNGWGNQGYGYIPYNYITNSTLTGNTSSAPEFYMVTKTSL